MVLQVKYQSNTVLATELFNDFNGLYFWLEAKKEQFKNSETFKLFEASQDKLNFYLYENGMPSMGLFRSSRFLDPRQFNYFEKDINQLIIDIPELKGAEDQWLLYLDTIKESKFEVTFSITEFWLNNKKKLSKLFSIAEWLLYFPNNSADCERSISIYNKILTDDRNRLTEDAIVHLNFIYFNKKNFSKALQAEEISEENDNDCILVDLIEEL
jgi:hypothetical protein